MMTMIFQKPTFSSLVRDYTKLVYYFSRKLISNYKQDDADDIVSETFMKAFKAYPTAIFQHQNSIKSWLLSICHNIIRNNHRTSKHFMTITEEEFAQIPDSKTEDLLDIIVTKEAVEHITLQLEKLPAIEQELVHLRIYEELSFAEIGEIFELKEPTVKMRFYRTIQKIREAVV